LFAVKLWSTEMPPAKLIRAALSLDPRFSTKDFAAAFASERRVPSMPPLRSTTRDTESEGPDSPTLSTDSPLCGVLFSSISKFDGPRFSTGSPRVVVTLTKFVTSGKSNRSI